MNCRLPMKLPEPAFSNAMQRHFGGPVDILVQGHSHVEGTKRFRRHLGGKSG